MIADLIYERGHAGPVLPFSKPQKRGPVVWIKRDIERRHSRVALFIGSKIEYQSAHNKVNNMGK